MVLRLQGVEKSYPGVRALKGVDLSVEPGRVHALLGENGAGKSTLIKVASGAVQPDAGSIFVDGAPVHLTPKSARSAGIRVIHQERQIAWTRSVADNVLLDSPARSRIGLVTARATMREAKRRMDRVGIDLDPAAPAWTLSVAELQLLELARAVTEQARVIIMDEPTASLHRAEVQQLFRVVRQVRDKGVAVVYISHHLDEVMELADEYTVMRDGNQITSGSMVDVTMSQLVRDIFGSDVSMTREDVYGGTAVEAGDTAIELKNASFGNAVRSVSLEVRRGEVVVITGAVGCGSHEVSMLMSGAVRPTAGVVELNGKPGLTRRNAAREGIGYLPADRKRLGLMLERSVAENALLAEGTSGALGLVTNRSSTDRARKACEQLGVKTADVRNAVRGLSGGNQQKVILARWQNAGSDVLILDEPTAGIDIPSKVEIYRNLRRSAANGMAVAFVSTEYQEIGCVADRVLVMRDGQIVGEVAGDEATEERLFELEFGDRQ